MFKPVYDSEQHVQEPLGTEEWLAYQKQLTNQHYQDLHDAQQNTYIEEIIAEQDLYIKEYQAEMDKQIRLYELEREIHERQVPKPPQQKITRRLGHRRSIFGRIARFASYNRC